MFASKTWIIFFKIFAKYMSFASVKSTQFANTSTYSFSGSNNSSGYHTIFSKALPAGKYIYQIFLDLETTDTLTSCIINVGQKVSSAGAIFTNRFKYDQPRNQYYCNVPGVYEGDGTNFQMNIYVSTRIVNHVFDWKGTCTICKIV